MEVICRGEARNKRDYRSIVRGGKEDGGRGSWGGKKITNRTRVGISGGKREG